MKINDLFDYDLKICQDSDFFKFSVDSILLGEVIKIKKNYKVLDMCTGNAPIPLILTTKNKNITIDAVEIQENIYNLAKKSVDINKLNDIIEVYNCDIKDYIPKSKYDVVACNPPYFKTSDKNYLNKNMELSIARHEIKVNLQEIISLANSFLKENGKFYLVNRTERLLETLFLLEKEKFGIRKVYLIYTGKNKNARIFLVEANKSQKTDIKYYSMFIDNRNSYKGIFEVT